MGKKKNLDDLKANIDVIHNRDLKKLKGGTGNKIIKKKILVRGCSGNLPQ